MTNKKAEHDPETCPMCSAQRDYDASIDDLRMASLRADETRDMLDQANAAPLDMGPLDDAAESVTEAILHLEAVRAWIHYQRGARTAKVSALESLQSELDEMKEPTPPKKDLN